MSASTTVLMAAEKPMAAAAKPMAESAIRITVGAHLLQVAANDQNDCDQLNTL